MTNSNIIISLIVLIIVVVGAVLLTGGEANAPTDAATSTEPSQATTTQTPTTTDTNTSDEATTTDSMQGEQSDDQQSVVTMGNSAGGHEISAHTFGNGDTQLLFVAGLHGGYDWNTVKLADRMIGWFEANPSMVPESVTVTVIPNMNPDGLETVFDTTETDFDTMNPPSQEQTVAGRFNANDVDLNRNFACNWQSEGTWQNRTVDAGSSAFSEPETQALRDWVNSNSPDKAVVFYSAAGAVYSSACNDQPSTASTDLMNTYAQASGYPAEGEFAAYEVTGDAVDWMAKQGVPGISVLLSNHQDTQWERNKAAVEALLQTSSE